MEKQAYLIFFPHWLQVIDKTRTYQMFTVNLSIEETKYVLKDINK